MPPSVSMPSSSAPPMAVLTKTIERCITRCLIIDDAETLSLLVTDLKDPASVLEPNIPPEHLTMKNSLMKKYWPRIAKDIKPAFLLNSEWRLPSAMILDMSMDSDIEYAKAEHDMDGELPTNLAVLCGSVKCLRFLLALGVDLTAVSTSKLYSPWVVAVRHGIAHKEKGLLEMLGKHMTDSETSSALDVPDAQGLRSIHHACMPVETGGKVHEPTLVLVVSTLKSACPKQLDAVVQCSEGNEVTTDKVRLLGEAAGKVGYLKQAPTPVHLCAWFKCWEGAKLLLKNGCNPAAVDARGESFLFAAAAAGSMDFIDRCLQEFPVRFMEVSPVSGETVMHVVLRGGCVTDTVMAHLQKEEWSDLFLDDTSTSDVPAFLCLLQIGDWDMAKAIVQKKREVVLQKDKSGGNALHYACNSPDPNHKLRGQIVNWLLDQIAICYELKYIPEEDEEPLSVEKQQTNETGVSFERVRIEETPGDDEEANPDAHEKRSEGALAEGTVAESVESTPVGDDSNVPAGPAEGEVTEVGAETEEGGAVDGDDNPKILEEPEMDVDTAEATEMVTAEDPESTPGAELGGGEVISKDENVSSGEIDITTRASVDETQNQETAEEGGHQPDSPEDQTEPKPNDGDRNEEEADVEHVSQQPSQERRGSVDSQVVESAVTTMLGSGVESVARNVRLSMVAKGFLLSMKLRERKDTFSQGERTARTSMGSTKNNLRLAEEYGEGMALHYLSILNEEGHSAMAYALQYSMVDVITVVQKRFAAAAFFADPLLSNNSSILHIAAQHADANTLRAFIKWCAFNREDVEDSEDSEDEDLIIDIMDATRVNDDGDSPLHLALKRRDYEIAQIILEVNPNLVWASPISLYSVTEIWASVTEHREGRVYSASELAFMTEMFRLLAEDVPRGLDELVRALVVASEMGQVEKAEALFECINSHNVDEIKGLIATSADFATQWTRILFGLLNNCLPHLMQLALGLLHPSGKDDVASKVLLKGVRQGRKKMGRDGLKVFTPIKFVWEQLLSNLGIVGVPEEHYFTINGRAVGVISGVTECLADMFPQLNNHLAPDTVLVTVCRQQRGIMMKSTDGNEYESCLSMLVEAISSPAVFTQMMDDGQTTILHEMARRGYDGLLKKCLLATDANKEVDLSSLITKDNETLVLSVGQNYCDCMCKDCGTEECCKCGYCMYCHEQYKEWFRGIDPLCNGVSVGGSRMYSSEHIDAIKALTDKIGMPDNDHRPTGRTAGATVMHLAVRASASSVWGVKSAQYWMGKPDGINMLTSVDDNQRTCIHEVARLGVAELLDKILKDLKISLRENIENPDQSVLLMRDIDGLTPLQLALSRRHEKCVDLLLKMEVPTLPAGDTPLIHDLLERIKDIGREDAETLDLMKNLLSHPNCRLRSEEYGSVYHHAVKNKCYECQDIILAKNAEVQWIDGVVKQRNMFDIGLASATRSVTDQGIKSMAVDDDMLWDLCPDSRALEKVVNRKQIIHLEPTPRNDLSLLESLVHNNGLDSLRILVGAIADNIFPKMSISRNSGGGESLLHTAVNLQRDEVVDLLLENHGKIDLRLNHKDPHGKTALYSAIENGQESLALKIASKIDFSKSQDSDICLPPNNVLHAVIDSGMEKVLPQILKISNLSIKSRNSVGELPLQHALRKGRQECVKILLSSETNAHWESLEPNQLDSEGFPPLANMVRWNCVDSIPMFLELQVDVDVCIKTDEGEVRGLLFAIQSDVGHQCAVEMIKYMCEDEDMHKCCNKYENDEESPLATAIRYNRPDVVSSLMQCPSIEYNMKGKDGMTPLQMGQRVTVTDEAGNSSLDSNCARMYLKKCIERSISDVLINDIDEDGMSPLARAIRNDDIQLLNTLLRFSYVDINTTVGEDSNILEILFAKDDSSLADSVFKAGSTHNWKLTTWLLKNGHQVLHAAAVLEWEMSFKLMLPCIVDIADLNYVDPEENLTLLGYCVEKDRPQYAKILMDHCQLDPEGAYFGIDPNAEYKMGLRHPIIHLIEEMNYSLMGLMISIGAFIGVKHDVHDCSLLNFSFMIAIEQKDPRAVKCAKVLLSSSLNMIKFDPDGKLPDYQHLNVHEKNADGVHPLVVSSKNNWADIRDLLLQHVARDPNDGLFLTSVTNSLYEAVETMMTMPGLDMNMVDDQDRTCLIISAEQDDWKMCKKLVTRIVRDEASVVDQNAKDLSGNTALAHAIRHGSTDNISSLLSIPNIRLDDVFEGRTAWTLWEEVWAERFPDEDNLNDDFWTVARAIVRNMGKNGLAMDLSRSANEMETPVHTAIRHKKGDIVRLFMQHENIDYFAVDSDGKTVLRLAFDMGEQAVVVSALEGIRQKDKCTDCDVISGQPAGSGWCLMACINNEWEKAITELVRFEKVDMNHVFETGRTPLLEGISTSKKIAKVILETCVEEKVNLDVAAMDQEGSALLYCIGTEYEDLMPLILKFASCDPARITIDHRSFGHIAVERRSTSSVEMFANMVRTYGHTLPPAVSGYDINMYHEESGKTPMLMAVELGYEDMVDALLAFPGMKINERFGQNQTSTLIEVVNMENQEWVEVVIAKLTTHCPDLDVMICDNSGKNALMYAIDNLMSGVTRTIIAHKSCDVTNIVEYVLPLWEHTDDPEMILTILRSSLDNNKDMNLDTPSGGVLFHAIDLDHSDVVDTLLKCPTINVDSKSPLNGYTPLMYAIENSRGSGIPMMFLKADAPALDVEVVDNDGNTVLHHAVINDATKVLDMMRLRFPKCDANVKNKDKDTPLHVASRGEHTMAMKSLFHLTNLDPNRRNADLSTPLHVCLTARYTNHPFRGPVLASPLPSPRSGGPSPKSRQSVVNIDGEATPSKHEGGAMKERYLQTFLAQCKKNSSIPLDLQLTDNTGDTPLHLAVRYEDLAAVEILMRYKGINMNHRNNDGYSVLHLACEHETHNCLLLLLKISLELQYPVNLDLVCTPPPDEDIMAPTEVGNAVQHIILRHMKWDRDEKLQAIRAIFKLHRVKGSLCPLDCNMLDVRGVGPTLIAMLFNCPRIAQEYLTEFGTGVDLKQSIDGMTLFHFTVDRSQICMSDELTLVLINVWAKYKKSRDIGDIANARNESLQTPLHLMAINGEVEPEAVSKFLAREEVDVRVKDKDKATPFSLAVEHENITLVSELIRRKDLGVNTLHSMVLKCAKCELDDLPVSFALGMLDCALKEQNPEKKFHVNDFDVKGKASIYYSILMDNYEITMKILRFRGANLNNITTKGEPSAWHRAYSLFLSDSNKGAWDIAFGMTRMAVDNPSIIFDPNQTSVKERQSPILRVVEAGDLAMAAVLIRFPHVNLKKMCHCEPSAKEEGKDCMCVSPIMLAFQKNDRAMLQIILQETLNLKHEMDVRERSKEKASDGVSSSLNLLQRSVHNEYAEICEQLLQIDHNILDSVGRRYALKAIDKHLEMMAEGDPPEISCAQILIEYACVTEKPAKSIGLTEMELLHYVMECNIASAVGKSLQCVLDAISKGNSKVEWKFSTAVDSSRKLKVFAEKNLQKANAIDPFMIYSLFDYCSSLQSDGCFNEVLKTLGSQASVTNVYLDTRRGCPVVLYTCQRNLPAELRVAMSDEAASAEQRSSSAAADGPTALQLAILNDHIECVQILLEEKADLFDVDDKGNSALHYAVQQVARGTEHDYPQLLMDQCVENGNNTSRLVNMLNKKGRSPLFEVSYLHVHSRERENTVKLLLAHDVHVNHQDRTGLTCLHLAAQHGNLELSRLLISSGAKFDESTCDKSGKSVLSYAVQSGNIELVEYFINEGAYDSSRDTAGKSISDAAGMVSDNHFSEMSRHILKYLRKTMVQRRLPCTIMIVYCSGCKHHKWHTRHTEEQYYNHMKFVSEVILQNYPGITIEEHPMFDSVTGERLVRHGIPLGCFELYWNDCTGESFNIYSATVAKEPFPTKDVVFTVIDNTIVDLNQKYDPAPSQTIFDVSGGYADSDTEDDDESEDGHKINVPGLLEIPPMDWGLTETSAFLEAYCGVESADELELYREYCLDGRELFKVRGGYSSVALKMPKQLVEKIKTELARVEELIRSRTTKRGSRRETIVKSFPGNYQYAVGLVIGNGNVEDGLENLENVDLPTVVENTCKEWSNTLEAMRFDNIISLVNDDCSRTNVLNAISSLTLNVPFQYRIPIGNTQTSAVSKNILVVTFTGVNVVEYETGEVLLQTTGSDEKSGLPLRSLIRFIKQRSLASFRHICIVVDTYGVGEVFGRDYFVHKSPSVPVNVNAQQSDPTTPGRKRLNSRSSSIVSAQFLRHMRKTSTTSGPTSVVPPSDTNESPCIYVIGSGAETKEGFVTEAGDMATLSDVILGGLAGGAFDGEAQWMDSSFLGSFVQNSLLEAMVPSVVNSHFLNGYEDNFVILPRPQLAAASANESTAGTESAKGSPELEPAAPANTVVSFETN